MKKPILVGYPTQLVAESPTLLLTSSVNTKMTLTGVDICRIVEGKVIAAASVNDFVDFFTPLGIIDYKGFPDEVGAS